MTPEALALLDTIAGTESPGYDRIYGGQRFADLSDHPRVAVRIESGPNRGRTSSAAGRYQFLAPTWDALKSELGLQDFGPESQDRAALALAAKTYGPTLEEDLKSNDPRTLARVGQVLKGVWTSLPGGIESRTTPGRFVAEFRQNLRKRSEPSLGERALNFLFPAAEAGEIPPPPAGYDWKESSDEPIPPPPAGFDWKEVGPEAVHAIGGGGESTEPGSLKSGFARGIEKQMVGAQQLGSDIARMASGELGQPYSEYRRGVNEHARRLAEEDRRQGTISKLGENVLLPLVEMAPLPIPASFPARLAVNAAAGGTIGALRPAETATERGWNAVTGGAAGALFPEAVGLAGMAGRGAGPEVVGIVSPRTGARMIMRRERANIPPEMRAAVTEEARGGAPGTHRVPEGQMGPEIPDFGNIPGLQMTVGSTGGPEEIFLENLRRVQHKAPYFARDEANLTRIYDELESQAPTRQQSEELRQRLNEQTTPLRESAINAIRQNNAMPEAVAPLAAALSRFETEEGARANRHAQTVAKDIANLLETPNLGPLDLYEKRKVILDTLRGRGTPANELDASIKSARRQSMEFVRAIDEGLEAASGGQWTPYLKTHAQGMKPIEEGEAMRDVVAAFDSAQQMSTGVPLMTAGKLQRASEKMTFKELTSRLQDVLSPENRAVVEDAINALHAIQRVQRGTPAVSGARTSSDLTTIMRAGLKGKGGGLLSDIFHMADAIGANRAGNMLDEAMMNPELYRKMITEAETKPNSLAAQYFKKMIGGVPGYLTRQPNRK